MCDHAQNLATLLPITLFDTAFSNHEIATKLQNDARAIPNGPESVFSEGAGNFGVPMRRNFVCNTGLNTDGVQELQHIIPKISAPGRRAIRKTRAGAARKDLHVPACPPPEFIKYRNCRESQRIFQY